MLNSMEEQVEFFKYGCSWYDGYRYGWSFNKAAYVWYNVTGIETLKLWQQLAWRNGSTISNALASVVFRNKFTKKIEMQQLIL